MKEFFVKTFTRPKLQKLVINTAVGNFAGYVAGSLVTVAFTYRSLESRAVKNLFGLLPRKEVVVHILPTWAEWTLGVVLGFTVAEFVRYSINSQKYDQLIGEESKDSLAGKIAAASDGGDLPDKS